MMLQPMDKLKGVQKLTPAGGH